MPVNDIPVTTLSGEPTTVGAYAHGPMLVVNVASKCGLTPQYEGLQQLYDRYAAKGLQVLGFPCNQFMGQEPGTSEEIAQFCATTYDVTFPMFAKIEVNGPGRHPLYAELTGAADDAGEAGDVQWNFEKFLLDADGTVLHRFRPGTEPLDPEVTTAIETGAGRHRTLGMRHADRPTFSESVIVAAAPERVWALVSDIGLSATTSAELQSVRWVDGDPAAPPAVGRRFVGRNANRHFGEWETTSTVTECDPPRTFAWDVGDPAEPNTRWRFTLERADGGTQVTQWGQLGYGDSGLHVAIRNMPDKEERIVARRLEEFRAAVRANLDAVKQAVERG